jgi:bifunctional DNA-binding transcriptional regulator/antitoxin component of YhaV-PrlF toxin-antitoxin module
MKDYKDLTITSKNQITIPVSFVKKLNLSNGRSLRAYLQGDSIILKSNNNFKSDMQKFWSKRQTNVSLNDEQLKLATKQAVVKNNI